MTEPSSDSKTILEVKKPSERWLLTRKTWRYMTDAKSNLVAGKGTSDVRIDRPATVARPSFPSISSISSSLDNSGFAINLTNKDEAIAATSAGCSAEKPTASNVSTHEVLLLEKRFQETCNQRKEFLLWAPTRYPSGYGQQAKMTVSLSSRPSIDHCAVTDESGPMVSSISTFGQGHSNTADSVNVISDDSMSSAISTSLDLKSAHASGSIFEMMTPTSPLYPAAPDAEVKKAHRKRQRHRWSRSTGTQTEAHCFFDLEIEPRLSVAPTVSSISGIATSQAPDARLSLSVAASNSQGDKNQHSFSNAVMKYFGMGRKKTEKDKKDGFKTINYDRNWRNLKSKNANAVDGEPESPESVSYDCKPCVAIQVGDSQLRFLSTSNAPLVGKNSVDMAMSSSAKAGTMVDNTSPTEVMINMISTRPSISVNKSATAAAPEKVPSTASIEKIPRAHESVNDNTGFEPIPYIRQRKITLGGVLAMIPFTEPQTQPSTPTATAITDDSGRWTTSPRFSITTSEEFGLQDVSVSSGLTGDDNVCTFEPELMVDDLAFDLASDLEFRVNSSDTTSGTIVDMVTNDFGPRHIFFGDQFKVGSPAKSADIDMGVDATSTLAWQHQLERLSLPVLQLPVPIKSNVRSFSSVEKGNAKVDDSRTLVKGVGGSGGFGGGARRRKTSPLSSAALHVASGLHLNSLLSAVMYKSKSGVSLSASAPGLTQSTLGTASQKESSGHTSRIMTKKIWKTRSKSQSRATASSTCIWTPQVNPTAPPCIIRFFL